jgi:hypothetical protein
LLTLVSKKVSVHQLREYAGIISMGIISLFRESTSMP